MSLTRQKFILLVCIFSLYTGTVYGDDPVGVLLTGPEKAAVGRGLLLGGKKIQNKSNKKRVLTRCQNTGHHPKTKSLINWDKSQRLAPIIWQSAVPARAAQEAQNGQNMDGSGSTSPQKTKT